MKTDAELLGEFANRGAENAFAELVKRHISVVYSAACRETRGDLSAAEDVTQLVFIELGRKAATLQRHPTLVGWLYTSVRYVSANLRRTDRRRNIREQEACAMNDLIRPVPSDPSWQEIRPVIDDALHDLDERDRDAVLLRFFEDKNLREVGEGLCLGENAARMRVDRALEKLRQALAKRGVSSTSSALATALVVGVVAAPPALMATVTSSALAAATVTATSGATLFGVATVTKLKMLGFSALVVKAVSIPIWQQQRYERLARENATLRNQLEQIAQPQSNEGARSELIDPLRFHEATPAAPKPEPREQQKAPEANRGNVWRKRFEAVYKLRGGKMLQRVSAPFIPERAEYCRREFSNQGSAPDYLILHQDAKGFHPRGVSVAQGITQLEGVLRHVLGLKRYEFYGADELLATTLPGDWVIRPAAKLETQFTDLEAILKAATGRDIRFEKSPIDNDVIVVRGDFAPAKEGQKFDVFAENRDKDWSKSSRGNFQHFLESLGDCLNAPFVSEVKEQNKMSISWFCHADADYSRAGNRRLELLNKVLANLQQQTSLSFALERRPAEVWLVKEQH